MNVAKPMMVLHTAKSVPIRGHQATRDMETGDPTADLSHIAPKAHHLTPLTETTPGQLTVRGTRRRGQDLGEDPDPEGDPDHHHTYTGTRTTM